MGLEGARTQAHNSTEGKKARGRESCGVSPPTVEAEGQGPEPGQGLAEAHAEPLPGPAP